MKKVTTTLFCFFLLYTSVLVASDSKKDETPGSKISASDLSSTILEYFRTSIQNIKKLTYSEFNMKREVISGRWAGDYVVHFLWKEAPNRFYCEWIQRDRSDTEIHQKVAYDGNRMYVLDTDDTPTLYIKSGYDANRVHLRADEFLISPFRFPLRYLNQEQNAYPSLESLTNLSNYQFLLEKCDNVEVHEYSTNGHSIIQLALYGLVNPVTNERENLRIHLDKSLDMFPISYEITTSDDRSIMKYEVTEFGEIEVEDGSRSVRYPKVAEGSYFRLASEPNESDKEPVAVYRYTVSDPLFSTRPLYQQDSASFSIDPATVDRIIDEDSNQLITVPK